MRSNQLKAQFSKIDIELNDTQIQQFIQYFDQLILWNSKMNLTAITAWDDVVVKHFLDSVISSTIVNYESYNSLIDVGTGAGFPGIPLKIIFPHLKVTLVDALSKRVNFLDTVISTLQLKDVEAIHGRAEDLARTTLRDSSDLCVSRAVSRLNILCEYCMPFIRPGGLFISYKGSKTMDELEESNNAIKTLGGKVLEVTDQVNLDDETNRGFVIIEKLVPTDKKYPRKAGKALKRPL